MVALAVPSVFPVPFAPSYALTQYETLPASMPNVSVQVVLPFESVVHPGEPGVTFAFCCAGGAVVELATT
jgi:hypothetical protein